MLAVCAGAMALEARTLWDALWAVATSVYRVVSWLRLNQFPESSLRSASIP